MEARKKVINAPMEVKQMQKTKIAAKTEADLVSESNTGFIFVDDDLCISVSEMQS